MSRKNSPNYYNLHNVVSGWQWILEHSLASSLNLRSAILHSQFGLWMSRGHFIVEFLYFLYINELCMAPPWLCLYTRVSLRDQKTIYRSRWPLKDLLQDFKHQAVHPSTSPILPQSTLANKWICSSSFVISSCSPFQLSRFFITACKRTGCIHALQNRTCHTTIFRWCLRVIHLPHCAKFDCNTILGCLKK